MNEEMTKKKFRQKIGEWLAAENERDPMSMHERLGVATFVLCVSIAWSIYGARTLELLRWAL